MIKEGNIYMPRHSKTSITHGNYHSVEASHYCIIVLICPSFMQWKENGNQDNVSPLNMRVDIIRARTPSYSVKVSIIPLYRVDELAF